MIQLKFELKLSTFNWKRRSRPWLAILTGERRGQRIWQILKGRYCPGRKPPNRAVKRPARSYKNTAGRIFSMENATYCLKGAWPQRSCQRCVGSWLRACRSSPARSGAPPTVVDIPRQALQNNETCSSLSTLIVATSLAPLSRASARGVALCPPQTRRAGDRPPVPTGAAWQRC